MKTLILGWGLLLLFVTSCSNPYKKLRYAKVNLGETDFRWEDSYNYWVAEAVDEDNPEILSTDIKATDLELLECTGYNSASKSQKLLFWPLFMASISYYESSFDPHTRFYEESLNEYSEGLLQLSLSDTDHGGACTKINSSNILAPQSNLFCGMRIMKNQLSRFEGGLFPASAYYWSVLSNASKKAQVIDFFKKRSGSLEFCSAN